MRLPGLDHWAALREVVERGGVSEAAKSLNVGQPAVTKRLQALEACYGVPLLERRGGRLSLTPAGRKVYALAAETLDRQQALITDLKTTSSGIRQLRLESTFTIGEHLLPRILVGFSERFPEYKIRLSLGYSRAIQTRLVTDLADLALVETAPEHPEILVQKWKEDELILVCGKGHPLASVNEIAVNQLHSLSFALREDSSGLRDSLIRRYVPTTSSRCRSPWRSVPLVRSWRSSRTIGTSVFCRDFWSTRPWRRASCTLFGSVSSRWCERCGSCAIAPVSIIRWPMRSYSCCVSMFD